MAPLRISIPTTQTESPQEGGKPFTTYTVKIEHPFPRASTTQHKRYSAFAALDASLRTESGSAPPAPLPPKSWLGALGIGATSNSPALVEQRRQGLERYLQAIETSEDGRWRVCKAYREFLRLDGKESGGRAGGPQNTAGAQFGRDRVRDASDWLDKYAEVKSNLQDARRCLTQREQATAPSAQHEAGANAKKGLVRAGTLLSALDEGLQRLGGGTGKGAGPAAAPANQDWPSEKLGEGELRRRKDLISTLRKERDGLESVLNTMAAKAAAAAASSSNSSTAPSTSSTTNPTPTQKSTLFNNNNNSSRSSTPSSSRRVLGAPVPETDRTRELDNAGVLQLQRQVMQEQDEDVLDLAKVVRRMKEMGVQINEEIVEQNAMLDGLEGDVQRVDGKMKVAKKRIGGLK